MTPPITYIEADSIGPASVEAIRDEDAVEPVPETWEVLVELVLEVRERHRRTSVEQGVEQLTLVGLEARPLVARLLQRETVILAGKQAEEMFILRFGDVQVTADSEVHDGRRDVPHVRLAVDQRAEFRRRHARWRLGLSSDRRQFGIAPPSPPQSKHAKKDQRRNRERHVAVDGVGRPLD